MHMLAMNQSPRVSSSCHDPNMRYWFPQSWEGHELKGFDSLMIRLCHQGCQFTTFTIHGSWRSAQRLFHETFPRKEILSMELNHMHILIAIRKCPCTNEKKTPTRRWIIMVFAIRHKENNKTSIIAWTIFLRVVIIKPPLKKHFPFFIFQLHPKEI